MDEKTIRDIFALAVAEADKAAVSAKEKHGDKGAIGTGYVLIPLKLRKVVKALIDGKDKYGSGFKVESGWFARGYNWVPRVTYGLGQAAHIYFAAAEAAVKVLREHGIEANMRHYYD